MSEVRARRKESVIDGLRKERRPITPADYPIISEITADEAKPSPLIETTSTTAKEYKAPPEISPEIREVVERIVRRRETREEE